MTTEEKKNMDRANCATCLLAEKMRDCSRCKFFWALQERNAREAQNQTFVQFAARYLANNPNGAK